MAAKYRYLTPTQAQQLARFYYGLGLRTYKGQPLRNQNLIVAALKRKQLIDSKMNVTDLGVRELGRYCREWVRK